MKKTLKQAIIVFIVLSLITSTQALAQDVVEEENQEVLETQAKEVDLAQRKAEIAAKAAEKKAIAAEKKVEIERKKAEIAAEVAKREEEITASIEKHLEDTRKQVEATQKQVELLMPEIISTSRVSIPHLPHLQHSGGGGILVIPSADMKVENLAAITEDMSVMSRIFDKQVSQSNVQTARGRVLIGFDPYYWRGNRTTEAIYLEGYGALFLMKVNMLLSQPPQEQQKKEPQEDTDPVWTQFRREMYEPEDARRRRGSDQPEEKYDAEKVETLKTNLIKTIKHATNIRALESDQLVILTIIGDGSQPASATTRLYSYGRSTGRRRIVQTLPEVEANSVQPSVLTICAKKSDIDAFAKGEIDYDQFRQRTGIFKSYAKAGLQHSPVSELHQFAHEVLSVE
jgi:hypothetical protein